MLAAFVPPSLRTHCRTLTRTTPTLLRRAAYAGTSTPAAASPPAAFSASTLTMHPTSAPKPLVANSDLVFGHTFSDHMLLANWNATSGWDAPAVQPYGKICLEPSASVFHYAFECFEGMKAYKDNGGRIRLFRPDMNMSRFNRSCARLNLPTLSGPELIKCISELIKLDTRWIPAERGYSLYVRPTMIGTQQSLGVGPSTSAMMFVITGPVGPYYRTGFNAVRLYAQTEAIRAWPGGVGDCKVGGNYAPTVQAQVEAMQKGYQQTLWLFGPDHELTEVGTMNCFIYWKNAATGRPELLTPPLNGTILPGVTRDSILALARAWGEFDVREGRVTMAEVKAAVAEGRMLEMFGAGTACIVSPIKQIRYLEEDIEIPLDATDAAAQAGPLARRFNDMLLSIQYGEIEHEWSVVVN